MLERGGVSWNGCVWWERDKIFNVEDWVLGSSPMRNDVDF